MPFNRYIYIYIILQLYYILYLHLIHNVHELWFTYIVACVHYILTYSHIQSHVTVFKLSNESYCVWCYVSSYFTQILRLWHVHATSLRLEPFTCHCEGRLWQPLASILPREEYLGTPSHNLHFVTSTLTSASSSVQFLHEYFRILSQLASFEMLLSKRLREIFIVL